MKPYLKLTGKSFWHTADREGIQRLGVIDDPLRKMSVLVWVIGKSAYELRLESLAERGE